jgi:hypothetical protein
MVSSLFLFVGFALSNNKLHSFLHFGQFFFCCVQQSSTVGFSGSGLIVLFGGNPRLSVGFVCSGSILLFGLLVWFSSFVVALSLVDNTSFIKKKQIQLTMVFLYFLAGNPVFDGSADCQFDSAV